MTRRHFLKIWPEHYNAIARGNKRYEWRRDDRNPHFSLSDELVLMEWDPEKEVFTGRRIQAEIVHLTRGGRFGMPRGYCILGMTIIAQYQSGEKNPKTNH